MKTHKIDEYGIKEYAWWLQIGIAFIILYIYLGIMANALLFAESFNPEANIQHYKDAFWCLRLASNTIGYGDFYPTTEWGRSVITLTFYIGAGMVGVIVGVVSKLMSGRFDNSVQNRELRKQNQEIIKLLKSRK